MTTTEPEQITISLNGDESRIIRGATVRTLLEQKGLGGAACAVEINRRLVPRKEHENRTLNPGDKVEVVSLIGGG